MAAYLSTCDVALGVTEDVRLENCQYTILRRGGRDSLQRC